MAGAGSGIAAQENKRRLVSKASKCGQKFGKEIGCSEDFSTSVGRMKVNAKHVTRRKVQQRIGCSIAQYGTRPEGISKRPSVSGSKKRKLRRKMEVAKEYPMEQDHFRVKSRSPRSTREGACQQKDSRPTLPLTVPCGERLASGRACGWAVVQRDFDEEMGPLYGIYGSAEAEFEVQRTIKRAELTAFSCLLKRVLDSSRCMWTTKE